MGNTARGVDGSTAQPVGVTLQISLSQNADDLIRAVTAPGLFGAVGAAHAGWLRARYLEIVPIVLPDALHCIETGDRLSAASRACVGASARALRGTDVSLTVALRGGVPAMRAFSAVVESLDLRLSAREMTVVMGRAALIAQELAAYWVECWRESDGGNDVDGSSLHIEAHGQETDGDEADPAIEMVALAAAGQSTEQIAVATAYSTQAVKWHLGRLMKKWKVGNRSSLVAVGILRGALSNSRCQRDSDD